MLFQVRSTIAGAKLLSLPCERSNRESFRSNAFLVKQTHIPSIHRILDPLILF
jgi:hypothetical protein